MRPGRRRFRAGATVLHVSGDAPDGERQDGDNHHEDSEDVDVRADDEGGGFVYDVYAHCRDDKGGRPWLKTFRTFNSAVAWPVQHERDIYELIARNSPEPEPWPPPPRLHLALTLDSRLR